MSSYVSWINVVLVMTSLVTTGAALSGQNICTKIETYEVPITKTAQKPYVVREVVWCMQVPPRCLKTRTEYRTQIVTENVSKTRVVSECCEGYSELDERCVPLCWGEFNGCGENGKCVAPNICQCIPGYHGTTCTEGIKSGHFLLTEVYNIYNTLVECGTVLVSSFRHCKTPKADVIHVTDFKVNGGTKFPGYLNFSSEMIFKQNISAPITMNFKIFKKSLIYPKWRRVSCDDLGVNCIYPDICQDVTCPIIEGIHEIHNQVYPVLAHFPARKYKLEIHIEDSQGTPYSCYEIHFKVKNKGTDTPPLSMDSIVAMTASGLLLAAIVAVLMLFCYKIKAQRGEVKYGVLA